MTSTFYRGNGDTATRGRLLEGGFYAIVSRANQRAQSQVYAWRLPETLPKIRIPRKAPDADVIFDLPSWYRYNHERGRYARRIRYDRATPVTLSPEYRAWLRESGADGAEDRVNPTANDDPLR
ncbi:MAG: DUF4058 family protein [Planctomycetia bacterium]|nr:DUF4058 family protein [Planctomycetia bacterium]